NHPCSNTSTILVNIGSDFTSITLPVILHIISVNAPVGENIILKNIIDINAGTAQGNIYILLKNVLPLTLSLLANNESINPSTIANVVAANVHITVHNNIYQKTSPANPFPKAINL